MNINVTLIKSVSPYLRDYYCYEPQIRELFLPRRSFLEKQKEAIKIIENTMAVHGKEKLLSQVVELARVEHGIRELEPWVRDHVVHAVLSFILGIYLNNEFIEPTGKIIVNEFQWKLAGLFHDIGYPVQIAKDILDPFTKNINKVKKKLNPSAKKVYFKVVPVGLEDLTSGLNGFDLIQDCLDKWKLRINVRDEFDRMIASDKICHGIISALAVLNIIDEMYQKYNPQRNNSDVYQKDSLINWNQIYFKEDVVSACSAIFIHNLPDRCFTKTKISRSVAPVAFLLKLADCLQDWERPSSLDEFGLPANQFDIGMEENQLIFHANIERDRKDRIKREISSCLEAMDVKVI